jgi:hypothetical protein
MSTIKTSRVFDGKRFELRVQPSDKMHRGFIDPYTVGNSMKRIILQKTVGRAGKRFVL